MPELILRLRVGDPRQETPIDAGSEVAIDAACASRHAAACRVGVDEGRESWHEVRNDTRNDVELIERDVAVVFDPTHTVAELAVALAEHVGLATAPDLASDRCGVLGPDRPIGAVDLVSGDLVVLGSGDDATRAAPPAPPQPHGRHIAVDVVAGPDAGRSHLIGCRGTRTLGRAETTDVTFDDPSVSRQHAALELGPDGAVVLHPDALAANGVTVNGADVSGAVPLAPTDIVGLGGTRIAVRPVERSERHGVDRLGQFLFHRTPYRPPIVTERAADPIGPIPERPDPRRLQLLVVLAPLAAGAAMFALTGQAQFLLLTLISPIVMVGTVVEERRSGRRTFRAQLATFRAALIEHRDRFERMRASERAERFRSAPDLAELIRRAEFRTIDLWARGRTAPDFLVLRLGLGSASVRFAIELDRGGDPDLRAEATTAMTGLDRLNDVPVSIDLTTDAIVGVHGDPELVAGLAASIIWQAVALHSPEDLVVVVACGPRRSTGWAKWLPHTRSVVSPVPGNHVVQTTDAADRLVERLIDVAAARADGAGCVSPRTWPRVLGVFDAELEPDPAAMARLLDLAPDAGISLVWLGATAADVPRQATRTLVVRRSSGAAERGRMWSTDPDVDDEEFEVDQLRADLADRAARALAPVRDASTASLATSIPRTAPLLDALRIGRPTAAWVGEQWLHPRGDGHHLRFPIGIGADGPVEVDLVDDGPHTLIGGTSGAGKSELLQSMVAALAVLHSPARLNFLFVDYKGGASSQVFERLPHTVGHVTNLNADLAGRVLTSLRAELHRRMATLEGRAKDLAEMLTIAPHDAPPSLVIVIDEFATLVKEVPEFMAGIVDIAQRGRSLGIHLVLATQRPSGAVDENILANTNLRISLRMLDRGESTAVIAAPDAADIPVPLRGRGLVRLGPRQLVEFQSAFGGAPLTAREMRPPVLVGDFDRTDPNPRATPPPAAESAADGTDTTTHLEAVLGAVAEANRRLDVPAPRQPWCDVLPDIVTIDEVLADGGSASAFAQPGRFVAIGVLDDPEHQDQRPAVLDLERSGGCLVFGTGGSGKTTTLRTIAASVAATATAGEAVVVAFDFASRGLSGLAALPEVVDVATGDDLEAATRQLLVLDAELERRRHLLAAAEAEHMTAYARDRDDAPPRIIVLIDGFDGLTGSLVPGGAVVGDDWSELVLRLVTDGRQVGIHTVITVDRRNAIPTRLHSAIGHRIILRHADETSVAEHGIRIERARSLADAAGRGLLDGGLLVQIASVSVDASARGQAVALAASRERLGRRRTRMLPSAPLPERLPARPCPPARSLRVDLGRVDVVGDPAVVVLEWSNLTICGPARSGRSTALATAVAQLCAHHDVTVVGSTGSPLRSLVGTVPMSSTFGRAPDVAPVLDRLANQLEGATEGALHLLVVDDADEFDDPTLAPVLRRLCQCNGLRLVSSLETRSMCGYTTNPFVDLARRARRLLVLRPDDPGEFLQTTGVKLRLRPGLRMPPGRGVLLVDRMPSVVQVATIDPVSVDRAGVDRAGVDSAMTAVAGAGPVATGA